MKEIIMYSSPTWPHCTTAKEFLIANNMKFIVKDASVDQVARQEMAKYNMNGVPSFYIEGDIIVGFDKNKLLSYIDFKIFTCSKCNTKMRVPKDKGTIMLKCKTCETKYKIKT